MAVQYPATKVHEFGAGAGQAVPFEGSFGEPGLFGGFWLGEKVHSRSIGALPPNGGFRLRNRMDFAQLRVGVGWFSSPKAQSPRNFPRAVEIPTKFGIWPDPGPRNLLGV